MPPQSKAKLIRALFTAIWCVAATGVIAWKWSRVQDVDRPVAIEAQAAPTRATPAPVVTASVDDEQRPQHSRTTPSRLEGSKSRALPTRSPFTEAPPNVTALSPASAEPPASARSTAMALFEAGKYGEALPYLEQAIAAAPLDTDLHWAAARAASATNQPQRAVVALLTLADLRGLSIDEGMWLSGQLEAAGVTDAGLSTLYATLAKQQTGSERLWQRVGDLEAQRGQWDDASTAYLKAITQDCADLPLLRKAARAADRSDRHAVASSQYANATACAPYDAAVALEAARYHGGRGEPLQALPYYQRVAELGDPTVSPLELSRAALAAGRPDVALAWTTPAVERDRESTALRYVHAQALHLTQRSREADAELSSLLKLEPDNADVLAWRGRIALALGRHLSAYQLFGSALRHGGRPRVELLTGQGDAAAARGNLSRAGASYRGAATLAESDARNELSGKIEALHRRQTPQLILPVELLGDSSGIEVRQTGAQVLLWPLPSARVRGQFTSGRVEQDAYGFDRQALAIRADQIFLTAALHVDASLGLEAYSSSRQPVWRLEARQDLARGGFFAIDTSRETPWSEELGRSAQRYNRILNLAAVDTSFHSIGLRGVTEVPFGVGQAFRIDGGWRQFSDDNGQASLYVHYQRQLATREDGSLWIAVQPQVYAEQWSRQDVRYLSPAAHASAGAGFRIIVKRPGWSFDGTATPQVLVTDGRAGAGLLGAATAERRIGWLWISGGAMIFEDRRNAYQLRRVTGEVRIPLAR